MYFKSICILLGMCGTLYAQDSTGLDLQELTVTANIIGQNLKETGRNVTVIDQKTIAASPVKTVDGILQYALNIDVRSRSSAGVQADISIRGGHYDQTLILLNGQKMNDPQTGHHTLNIPVSIDQIERIEVLQGGASRVFGPSAFSGVINIITKKVNRTGGSLKVIGGQHKLLNASGYGDYYHHKVTASLGFDVLKNNGFALNTSVNKNIGYANLSYLLKTGSLDFSYGILSNKFGASNFYSPKFYNQYEEVASKVFSGIWHAQFTPKLSATLMANFRKHNDLYDFDGYLQKEGKLNSVNFHQTDVADIEWKFRSNNRFGKTAFGIEYRQENVKSNRLGEKVAGPTYVKDYPTIAYAFDKKRENYSGFLEHNFKINSLQISSGSLLNYNSQFGFAFYPGIDISQAVGKSMNVYASANRSLRLPTFTELFLNTSTVKADPNLLPEKAISYELGLKWNKGVVSGQAAVFYRQTKDAIDKVKRPELAVPTMENIKNINMMGIEVSEKIALNSWLNSKVLETLQFNYAYLNADRKEEGFQSFYTLNYLRHKFSTGLVIKPVENLNISLWYTYKFREGTYQWDAQTPAQAYKPVKLLDVRAAYSLKKVKLFADFNNLLNYQYFEFGFVQQPGRWISGGVKVDF
jgi:vitamin B12 transporter